MPAALQDQPFVAALRAAADRLALPTDLGSAVLERLPVQLRKRALVLARVAEASVLDRIQAEIERAVAGVSSGPGDYTNQAAFRERVRDLLALTDYRPQPGREGTISDLRTAARLDLVWKTETRLARGAGQHVANQRPTALLLFPAQELVRAEPRRTPRGYVRREGALVQVVANYWAKRWQEAGGQLYEGRMIARVNDPVWSELSRFGRPHPPFDFNSGMGIRRIGRREAVRLGVIQEGERVAPDPQAAEYDTAVPAPELGRTVAAALQQTGLRLDGEGRLTA